MKKRLMLLATVFALGVVSFMPATVNAGVSDSDSDTGEIIHTTTTNYFTKVVIKGTYTNTETGEKTNYTKEAEEVAGNYDSDALKAVIAELKDEFSEWAEGVGARNISFDKGEVTDYYYDVHDEITQANGSGSDVILVGDVDDLDSAYTTGGTITVNTVLDKHQTFTIIATADNKPKVVKYNLKDENGNSISFKENEGIVFAFTVSDVMQLTDEELEEAGVTKEVFNEYLANIKKAVSGKGDVLNIYQIFIHNDGVEVHTAKSNYTIRLKKTAEMKKYNTFKLTYVDDEFKTEKSIKLTDKGDYLEGELSHLSFYVLTGTNETTTKNPETVDKLTSDVVLMISSTLGLIGAAILMKKS